MKEKLLAAIREFELPLLVFPVLVTCIVALGFIFNCSCSIYEWWAAVALTIGLVWCRSKDKKVSAITTMYFMLSVFGLLICSHLTVQQSGIDDMTYHFPAIRLLAVGWNPVWQSTPEQIYAAFGIVPDTYRSVHMISMPRGVWYFCAAFYKFSGAHFNLYFPIVWFLVASVFYITWRVCIAHGKIITLAVCVGEFLIIESVGFCVDQVVAAGGIGVLISMAERIKNGKWNWPHLCTFTFWMCISKQTALLHCAVFWIVFVATLIIIRSKLPMAKLLALALICFALFAVVSVSPYITSYINYGSPFYPRYSSDENKYPTQNQTKDFLIRNEDAACMGHIGSYVNAFISPSIAKHYYIHKTGRKNFSPRVQTWGSDRNTPTTTLYRTALCCSLFVLCLFCGRTGIFLSAAIILGTLAMPTEMIGYVRYTPWALFGIVFCTELLPHSKLVKIFGAMIVLLLLVSMPKRILSLALQIDNGYALRTSLRENPPRMMICQPQKNDGTIFGPFRYSPFGRREYKANLDLLQSQVSALHKSVIIVDAREATSDIESCQRFYDSSFNVLPDYDMCKYSMFQHITQRIPDRKKRLLTYPILVARTFLVTLPKSIWEVIYG